jgi:hypothetical protein
MIKAYIKGIDNLPKDFTETWEKDEKGDYIEINKEQLLTVLLGINKLSGSPVVFNHNDEGFIEITVNKEE